MALSLIYGGPAPKFFSETVADFIVYGSASSASIFDIPDPLIKENLIKVRSHKYYCPRLPMPWTRQATEWNQSKLDQLYVMHSLAPTSCLY